MRSVASKSFVRLQLSTKLGRGGSNLPEPKEARMTENSASVALPSHVITGNQPSRENDVTGMVVNKRQDTGREGAVWIWD